MRIITAMMLALLVSGCATTTPQKQTLGDFSAPEPEHVETIVRDSSQQIIELYPPATTQILLQHEFDSIFGAGITNSLRQAGYAVFDLDDSAFTTPAIDRQNDGIIPAQITTIGLSYILDQPATDLYRVILLADEKSLSRAYVQTSDAFFAAGAWSYKE